MATIHQPPVAERRIRKAKPQPDMDREALRADINAQYANTLRYLGR